MKIFTKLSFYFVVFLACNLMYAQYTNVKVTAYWPVNSNENKIEVYDTANNLLLTICDEAQCYTPFQATTQKFVATYDLGCASNGNNYYIKIFDVNDSGWDSSSYVSVEVAGAEVLNNNGSTADSLGQTFYFDVLGGEAYCDSLPDLDGDLVKDYLDHDDDGDGVLDVAEGLGINTFDCQIPELNFENGIYDATASWGTEGSVGAIYRFGNAIQGYDILMEVLELDNTTIINIDDDSVDNPPYLQTRLRFSGTGTPGAKFKFTIVDAGTQSPAYTIFRIGGTTWDCDGNSIIRESTVYYGPSAYGIDNPSTLEVADLGSSNYQLSASGDLEGPGFSTLKVLRGYFQFRSNTFTIRMQAIKTTSDSITREYPMSFTQCDLLDFNATSLVIVDGEDEDNDGIDNHFDIDSDDDGIPDNVEAQSTTGYLAPSGTVDSSGVDTIYNGGIAIVDTDDDSVADILDSDSDNDGILDIRENGMPNSISAIDTDADGLDDNFEGSNLNDFDVNDEIDIPSSSILPDTDGDLAVGGDLDYRDGLDVYKEFASIDFDGIDDYIDTDKFLAGKTSGTLMAWVKPAEIFLDRKIVVGEEMFHIFLQNNLIAGVQVITDTGDYVSREAYYTDTIDPNKWTHLAAVYNASDSSIKIYINGKESFDPFYTPTVPGTSLSSTIGNDSTSKFTIGKMGSQYGTQFYKGAIDEVRVFDRALTEVQIQQLIHQEIQENSGFVIGKVVPKNIMDFNTNATIPWEDLLAYYPMTNILTSRTTDYSSYGRYATLHNITTIQDQTAPMPYQTVSDGLWSLSSTWLHGDVWDILNNPISSNPFSIIKVSNNITASNDIKGFGLILDDNKTLTIEGNHQLNNNWYLELNGTLDLKEDSQLIQSKNSDLVTDSDGKILRRQEGNTNYYWYNYWSAPVGDLSISTLTDNNTSSNNDNNTPFRISTLQDGSGNPIQFTSSYHQTGKVSTFWLYKFQNGITYSDWTQITPSTQLQPGVGYTQKGTGNAGLEQQYIFEGKPNNGTILVAADDVDGDSANESEKDVTLTYTLVGNPYPSALDAVKFINDNKPETGSGIINGTILLWEQWAGNSHYLAEYEGGYGYINTVTTERAYQHADIPIADQVQTQGIKTPTFFIPVGQSFFVEVIEDGDIEFNNDQRVFKSESLGESVFFRTANTNAQTSTTTNNQQNPPYQLIRLEFATSEGATRRFVVAFGDNASEGFDYGLDGGLIVDSDSPGDDMGSLLNGQQYVIQTLSPISPEKVVDLTLNASGNFSYSIKTVEILNIDDNQELYLRDNLNGDYYDLRSSTPYTFTSDAGNFTDRFDIVFQNGDTLSNNEYESESVLIFANNMEDKLYVKQLNQKAKQLTLTNMIGQTIKSFRNLDNQYLENGIDVSNLSTGVYMVSIQTENNQTYSKKIILN